MEIVAAKRADLGAAVGCLATAFAQDPITGFLLQAGAGYHERLTKFFSLVMQARIELGMPVLVARDGGSIRGAVMGYSTAPPTWPADITAEWERFEHAIPGMVERVAVYEGIAADGKPAAPHYYLGAIGTDPALQGRGIGRQLIEAFCALAANDPLSRGVYLETAKESNLPFYRNAGFEETVCREMGAGKLWCMFKPHGRA